MQTSLAITAIMRKVNHNTVYISFAFIVASETNSHNILLSLISPPFEVEGSVLNRCKFCILNLTVFSIFSFLSDYLRICEEHHKFYVMFLMVQFLSLYSESCTLPRSVSLFHPFHRTVTSMLKRHKFCTFYSPNFDLSTTHITLCNKPLSILRC